MNFKNLFILLFCLSTTVLTAQTTSTDSVAEKKSRVYRVELGYSQMMRSGSYISNTPFYNLRLGGNVEFPIKYNFGIETGLNYNFAFGDKTQYLGNKVTTTSDYYDTYTALDTVKYTYSNHSLHIPVRLTYTLPILWGFKLFGYAGPTFNIGLSEPLTIEATKGLYTSTGDYNLYSDNITYAKDSNTEKQVGLSRFNILLGAGGGIQWKSYRVKSGYDWGIINLSKTDDTTLRNKGWYVSFEYQF